MGDLVCDRTEPTRECVEFCKKHSAELYRTSNNMFYVVFPTVREAVRWADFVAKMGFSTDGEDLDFVVYAVCKAVVQTYDNIVRLL